MFIFFIAAAVETLGLPVITGLLNQAAGYLPHVLAAFLIVIAGIFIGNLVRGMIISAAASARLAYGHLMAQMA